MDFWEYRFGDSVFVAVGLYRGKILPYPLRNIFLKTLHFIENFQIYLNQHV